MGRLLEAAAVLSIEVQHLSASSLHPGWITARIDPEHLPLGNRDREVLFSGLKGIAASLCHFAPCTFHCGPEQMSIFLGQRLNDGLQYHLRRCWRCLNIPTQTVNELRGGSFG